MFEDEKDTAKLEDIRSGSTAAGVENVSIQTHLIKNDKGAMMMDSAVHVLEIVNVFF